MRRLRTAVLAALLAVSLVVPSAMVSSSPSAAAQARRNPCVILEVLLTQVRPDSRAHELLTVALERCYQRFPPTPA